MGGLLAIRHSGAMDGFRSLLPVPEEEFTLAILANTWPGRTNAIPELLAHQLVDLLLTNKLAPLPNIGGVKP